MHTVHDTRARPLSARAGGSAHTVYVDCADEGRADLVVLWLERAGYAVERGNPGRARDGRPNVPGDVLVTDRFGPGLAGEVVIGDLKAACPKLLIVVVGRGEHSEPAQLSLARVAGADATVPSPLTREALLRALPESR